MNIEGQRESLRNSLKCQFDLLEAAIEGIERGDASAMDLALDVLKLRRAQVVSVLLEMEIPLKIMGMATNDH